MAFLPGATGRVSATIVGTVSSREVLASLATTSVVPASAATVLLLAPNPARRNASFFNNSLNRILFLRLEAAASTSVFTAMLLPLAYYEIPDPSYDGVVTGVWSAGAGGSCTVTELTGP